jgi:HEPN domain-containing protein
MVRFERTHSLTLLLDLCTSLDKEFEKLKKDLEQLENYSVAVRYPGVKISVKIAEEAFITTKRVRQYVRKKLKL